MALKDALPLLLLTIACTTPPAPGAGADPIPSAPPAAQPPLDEAMAAQVLAAIDAGAPADRPIIAARGLLELERGRLPKRLLDALEAYTRVAPEDRPLILSDLAGGLEAMSAWAKVCREPLPAVFQSLALAAPEDKAAILRERCAVDRLEFTGDDATSLILALIVYGYLETQAPLHPHEAAALRALAAARDRPPAPEVTFDYAPIADQLTRVPAAIAAVYRFDLSADRNELTIDPQPRPPAVAARSAGARGFTARDSEDGGKILTLAGGPFRDAAWTRSALRALVTDPSRQQQIEAAGYALDEERDLLVVIGESDAEPTIFAFSADRNKLGIVGICTEVTLIDFRPGVSPPIAVRKPILYFYPERPTQIRVQVELDGEFIATYPQKPADGWTVTAHPDGTLHDPSTGRTHRYLFWEGTSAGFELDPARAHLVPGADAAPFLERACADYALRDEECTDLITYWLPALAANPYNLVEFVDDARYSAYARLRLDPAPDALIRLFMIFRASDHPVAVGAPPLPQRRRGRYTAVEWGGAELDAPYTKRARIQLH